jgi:hypothetical protein
LEIAPDRKLSTVNPIEMAFQWLGYAQHSGALPSGFVGEDFSVFSSLFLRLEAKSVKVARSAFF